MNRVCVCVQVSPVFSHAFFVFVVYYIHGDIFVTFRSQTRQRLSCLSAFVLFQTYPILLVVLKSLSEQLNQWFLRGAHFLRSKYMRRTLIAFTLVTILAGVFVLVKPAAAQDGLVDGVANAMINAFSSVMISIAGLFIQLTIFALKFFIEIAGYNNYIDADVVQIGWNMVRDIANMFFVVVLLVIAFGTILGLEQYEWKKTLVKLVMAAFFVNFSNLICQLIIDIGQVFTITFLNALAGAAGGNLIKMFNFDEIYNIATRGTDPTGIQLEFFAGSVMTIVFAGIAMFTMGAYLIVMIGRMVVLWTLMILSPLAFLFSALPNTQSYAQEFWNEFIHHVIVAPVMVFFLWLAFATFGGGNIVQSNIEANNPLIVEGAIVPITESTDASGQGLGASFSAAASWENMANFAVAIAFLWMGVERVQKLGVVGGGIVSGALNFGKNVATVASGLALARWMGGGAKNLVSGATKAVGKGLYDATIGNRVEIIGNRFKREVEGWKSWRAKGPQPRKEVDYKQGAEFERNENGKFIDENGNELKGKWKEQNGKFFDANGKEVDDKGNLLANGQRIQQYDPDGNLRYRVAKKDDGSLDFVDDRGAVQKWFYKRNEDLIKSRKNLDKVKKERDTREKLVDKRVTAVPRYMMQGEKDRLDGMDRLEQGMLEAEEARSAAKTKEFKAMGKELVMNAARFKDGEFQTEKGSIAQQEAAHVEKAKRYEELVKQGQSRARRDFLKDKKNQDIVQGRISGSLEVKALDTEAKRVEAGLTSGAMRGTLANLADFDAAKRAAMAANGGVLSDEDKEKFSDANREKFNVLDRQIAAEKQEHSEGIKQQGLTKNLEAQYLAGPHGTEELEEEARIKAGIAANEAFIKTAEENAEVRVKGEAGVQLADRARINAELAASAAKAQLDEIQGKVKSDVVKNEGSGYIVAQKLAELNAQTEAEVVKKMENQTRLGLIGTDEYNKFLEEQSSGKVVADTLSSKEKSEINQELRQRMAEGLDVEKKAREILKAAAQGTDAEKAAAKVKADNLRSSSSAWQYAAAKALEEENTLAQATTHNNLLSEVDQEVVHNDRGIQTPTTALTQAIEKYGKDYDAMDYDMFVSNLEGSLKSMIAKRNAKAADSSAPGVTEADKAALAGLLLRGQKENWIDDGIWKYMDSPELRPLMESTFGWKDKEFNYKKINDLMSIFASGGDMKFAGLHTKIADMMDSASANLSMSQEDFIENLTEGKFTDAHKQTIKTTTGIDVDTLSQGDIDYYMDQLDENQPQLQFIANLRDKAAVSSHPENGGHGRFIKLKSGKYTYILNGSQAARDSVMGEVRKIGQNTRSAMQTHATANLDEGSGFITTIREEDNRDIRGSITSANDYRGTNERYEIQTLGLASDEDKTEYRAQDGSLLTTGKKKSGDAAKRVAWLKTQEHGKQKFSTAQSSYTSKTIDENGELVDENVSNLDSDTLERQVVVNDVVEEIFAKRGNSGTPDFLLSMGKNSGVTDVEAIKGKMNWTVLVNGKEKKITEYNQFVNLYNAGAFNFGVPPKRTLSHYSPTAQNNKP